MAQLRKDGGRKPLADGRVTMSYGMRYDVHGGADGVTFRMFDGDKSYSLQLTNAELDQAIKLRDRFRDEGN